MAIITKRVFGDCSVNQVMVPRGGAGDRTTAVGFPQKASCMTSVRRPRDGHFGHYVAFADRLNH